MAVWYGRVMARLRASMAFPWPASSVWPYLIAFEQVPRWEDDVLAVEVLTPGDVAVGTRLRAQRVYAGRPAMLEGTIVDVEPGRRATMELRGGPLELVVATYAVDPTGDATSIVSYTATIRLRGLMRVLAPLVPLMGRIQIEKNLRRLQRRIAAGIPPTSDAPTPD